MEEAIVKNIGFKQFQKLSWSNIHAAEWIRQQRSEFSEIQLLAGNERSGVVIYSRDDGGLVFILGKSIISSLNSHFTSDEEENTFFSSNSFYSSFIHTFHYISLFNNDSLVIGLSNDVTTLFLLGLNSFLMKQKSSSPWKKIIFNEAIKKVRPHKFSESILILSEKGNLFLLNLNNGEFSDPIKLSDQISDFKGSITDLQWLDYNETKDNKKKTLLLTTSVGEIHLYDIAVEGFKLSKKKIIKSPNNDAPIYQLITFCHNSNSIIIIQCDKDYDTGSFRLYMVDNIDTESPEWILFDDPTHSFSENNSVPYFYHTELSSWGNVKHLIILGSSVSSDIGLLGKNVHDEKYKIWTIELDENMAILPMIEDLKKDTEEFDTYPTGMFLDSVSNSHSLPPISKDPNDPSLPPPPVLWILNTRGQLLGYQLALFDCSQKYDPRFLISENNQKTINELVTLWKTTGLSNVESGYAEFDTPTQTIDNKSPKPLSSVEGKPTKVKSIESIPSTAATKLPDAEERPSHIEEQYSMTKSKSTDSSIKSLPPLVSPFESKVTKSESVASPLEQQISSFEKELSSIKELRDDMTGTFKDFSFLLSSSIPNQQIELDRLNRLWDQKRSYLDGQMSDVTDLVDHCLTVIETGNEIKAKLDTSKMRKKENVDVSLPPTHSRYRRMFKARMGKISEILDYLESRVSLLSLATPSESACLDKTKKDPILVRLIDTIKKLNIQADEIFDNIQRLNESVSIQQQIKDEREEKRFDFIEKPSKKTFSFGLSERDCVINVQKTKESQKSTEKVTDKSMSYRQFRWSKLCTPEKTSKLISSDFSDKLHPSKLDVHVSGKNPELESGELTINNRLQNHKQIPDIITDASTIVPSAKQSVGPTSQISVSNHNGKMDLTTQKKDIQKVDESKEASIITKDLKRDPIQKPTSLVNKNLLENGGLSSLSIDKPLERGMPSQPTMPSKTLFTNPFTFQSKDQIPKLDEKLPISQTDPELKKNSESFQAIGQDADKNKSPANGNITMKNEAPFSFAFDWNTLPPVDLGKHEKEVALPSQQKTTTASQRQPQTQVSPFSFFASTSVPPTTTLSVTKDQHEKALSFPKSVDGLSSSPFSFQTPASGIANVMPSTPTSTSMISSTPTFGTKSALGAGPNVFGQSSFGNVTSFGQSGAAAATGPSVFFSSNPSQPSSSFSFSSMSQTGSNNGNSPFSSFAGSPAMSFAQMAHSGTPVSSGPQEPLSLTQKSSLLKSQAFTQFRG